MTWTHSCYIHLWLSVYHMSKNTTHTRKSVACSHLPYTCSWCKIINDHTGIVWIITILLAGMNNNVILILFVVLMYFNTSHVSHTHIHTHIYFKHFLMSCFFPPSDLNGSSGSRDCNRGKQASCTGFLHLDVIWNCDLKLVLSWEKRLWFMEVTFILQWTVGLISSPLSNPSSNPKWCFLPSRQKETDSQEW